VSFLTLIYVKLLELQCRTGAAPPRGTPFSAEELAVSPLQQWERPEWLNHLPPFHEGILDIPAAAAATLLSLQGLLFQHATEDIAVGLEASPAFATYTPKYP
jgi:hypothetical protein